MKQLVLLVTFILSVSSAHADVFKCHTADGVVYSETPCADNAMVVNTHAAEPSAEDAQAAREQTMRDNQKVDVFNNEASRDAQTRYIYAQRPPVIILSRGGTTTYVSGYRNDPVPHAPAAQAAPAAGPTFSAPTPVVTGPRMSGVRPAHAR